MVYNHTKYLSVGPSFIFRYKRKHINAVQYIANIYVLQTLNNDATAGTILVGIY